MDQQVINFLQKCRVQMDNSGQLHGQLIPRETFLSMEIYREVKPYITQLRERFSSSRLTSLQKTAEKDQKWPLLNLVRQILRICNYQMSPIRRSDGYDKNGKKRYRRYFVVTELKNSQNSLPPVEASLGIGSLQTPGP